jgi:hypothetical protein
MISRSPSTHKAGLKSIPVFENNKGEEESQKEAKTISKENVTV